MFFQFCWFENCSLNAEKLILNHKERLWELEIIYFQQPCLSHFLFICLSDEGLSPIFVQLLANLPLTAVEEDDCSSLKDTSDVFCHTISACKKNLFKLDRLQHKTKDSFPGDRRLGLQAGARLAWTGGAQPGERSTLNWGKHNRPVPPLVTVVAIQDEGLQVAVVARRSFGVGKVLAGMGSGGHIPGSKMSPYSSDGSYKNALCLGNAWLVI